MESAGTKRRTVLLADMNAFYATVEQARDPKLQGKPVLVAGNPEHRSGIILAASREAKRQGVKTAMTCAEALAICPGAILIRPHMQTYIDVSVQISEIAKSLTDLVEIYSIDELFIDTTGTEKLWGDAWAVARLFKQRVLQLTGVHCSVGIGPNKLVAKVCMDTQAKKAPEGIAQWKPEDIVSCMHPLPVSDLFGIGRRMEQNLFRMGIRTIGELAHYPLKQLKKRWGIMGEVYHMSAWGIDHSPVVPNLFHTPIKSIGHQITLHRDYQEQREIEIVLLELTEEVCRRLRKAELAGKTIHVGIRDGDLMHGFYRQCSLPASTNATRPIFNAVRQLFHQWWSGSPVRSVGVSISHLTDDANQQLDLFYDVEHERALSHAMDQIREKYGTTALMRGISLMENAVLRDRADKIGGHHA